MIFVKQSRPGTDKHVSVVGDYWQGFFFTCIGAKIYIIYTCSV